MKLFLNNFDGTNVSTLYQGLNIGTPQEGESCYLVGATYVNGLNMMRNGLNLLQNGLDRNLMEIPLHFDSDWWEGGSSACSAV